MYILTLAHFRSITETLQRRFRGFHPYDDVFDSVIPPRDPLRARQTRQSSRAGSPRPNVPSTIRTRFTRVDDEQRRTAR